MKKLVLALAVLGAASFSYSADAAKAADHSAAKDAKACCMKDTSCCAKDEKASCGKDCCCAKKDDKPCEQHAEKKADK